MERIAKYLSRAGVCSRRDVEKLIADGKVRVDGAIISVPATLVDYKSRIEVDGQRVGRKEKARLWIYHEPAGLVTTHKDPEGRATVFDYLPEKMPRVISVGRLDLNSEGLLLLTNDGELSRKLEHPDSALERTYRVRVFGGLDEAKLNRLGKGAVVNGIKYRPMSIHVESQGRNNTWLSITLTEGKNREIRKVVEDYMGCRVNRLIRTTYGPFALNNLAVGKVMEVRDFSSRLLESGRWK